LRRHRLEADDLGDIPAAFYVGGSGTVTRLTTVSIAQCGFEMRCVFEVLFVEVFVTGLTSVAPDILVCILRGRGTGAFLCGGIGK
jgi:hypothetical protein